VNPQDPFYELPRLKLLPIREQPAFRVAKNSDACSLAELLAVIIGGSSQIESAEKLLVQFGSIQKIAQAHVNELEKVPGISNLTALRLKAALALGRKLLQPEGARQTIQSPEDAAQILMPLLAHREQETMVVMPLSTRNHVLDVIEMYRGSLNASMVRVGELFKPALQRNAAAILIAHNHPSGDPGPSHEDVELTRAVVNAGKLLDVDVVDHLVIGFSRWISLKERRLGFS
ncbi:MAG: DNA repair protein RadC, partial [Anaerolineaceae bacterium]|nr:DNA repair protein RadC [Anaerolineaceae bacterium]